MGLMILMKIRKREIREIALREYAKRIGVSLQKLSNSYGRFHEPELVKRIREAEHHNRERRFLIPALLFYFTSFVSELIAWKIAHKELGREG